MSTNTLWAPAPKWLEPALPRRPRQLPSDLNTGAWLAFHGMEQRLDNARATMLAEAGAIGRDPDLVPARKPQRIEARMRELWAQQVAPQYRTAANINATRLQARAAIKAKLIERDASRPVQRQARLDRIADLMLGLSDTKREQLLLQALHEGNLDVLEAVVHHPAALESVGVKVSGTTTATNRSVIADKFARVLLPDDHARADELDAIVSSAVTALSFTNYQLAREIKVQVAEIDKFPAIRDLAGAWAKDGLDSFDQREPYRKAQLAHQNKGNMDADAELDRVAGSYAPIGPDGTPDAELERRAAALVVADATA